MTTVQIALPDRFAQEAQRAGPLSPARLECWLRDRLKAQRVDELLSAIDRMAAVDAQEIAAIPGQAASGACGGARDAGAGAQGSGQARCGAGMIGAIKEQW